MATTSWLFCTFDTDGEVIFGAANTLIYQIFNAPPNMNRAYFRLRRQDQ